MVVASEERLGVGDLVFGIPSVKSGKHFDHADARKGEDTVDLNIPFSVTQHSGIPLFEDFRKDICVKNRLRHAGTAPNDDGGLPLPR